MYRNQEGYADPTAGAVMKKLMTEYNRKKREERRRAQREKYRQQRTAGKNNPQNSANPNSQEETKNDC